MLARTLTHALVGLEARRVEVEAHVELGRHEAADPIKVTAVGGLVQGAPEREQATGKLAVRRDRLQFGLGGPSSGSKTGGPKTRQP